MISAAALPMRGGASSAAHGRIVSRCTSRPLAAAAYLLVVCRVFGVAASSGVPRSRLVETVSCKSFFVVQQGRAREQPRLAQGPEIRSIEMIDASDLPVCTY